MPKQDIKYTYIAGRPMDWDGDTHYDIGDEIPAEKAEALRHLEAFISSMYIYRVVDEKGYDRLPPHVYNAVKTRKEVEVALTPDPGHKYSPLLTPTPEQELADRQAEYQKEAHALINGEVGPQPRKRGNVAANRKSGK